MKKILLMALLVLPSFALATNGVFEINQLCVANGCFPGDDPGFPVEIANPGSYRLTSNLKVSARDETAIQVASNYANDGYNGLSIDLNGFSLIGLHTCYLGCDSANTTGYGFNSHTRRNITVHNGTIKGFLHGIYVQESILGGSDNLSFHDLTLTENKEHGIFIDGNALIDQIRASWNGISGVYVADSYDEAVLISNSLFFQNFGPGVDGGICKNNVFRFNNGTGSEETCDSHMSTSMCDGAPCP